MVASSGIRRLRYIWVHNPRIKYCQSGEHSLLMIDKIFAAPELPGLILLLVAFSAGGLLPQTMLRLNHSRARGDYCRPLHALAD
jgi:hypothetical protein